MNYTIFGRTLRRQLIRVVYVSAFVGLIIAVIPNPLLPETVEWPLRLGGCVLLILVPLALAIALSHAWMDPSSSMSVNVVGLGCRRRLTTYSVGTSGFGQISEYKVSTIQVARPSRGQGELEIACPFCRDDLKVVVLSRGRVLRNRMAVLFILVPMSIVIARFVWERVFLGDLLGVFFVALLALFAGGAWGMEALLKGAAESMFRIPSEDHKFFDRYELEHRNLEHEASLKRSADEIWETRAQRALEAAPKPPKRLPTSHPEYVHCSECGFEQWVGYPACQKCKAVFTPN